MLRKIISVPEGVYYRGRFRATTIWSKVSRRGSGEDLVPAAEDADAHGVDAPDMVRREGVISGKTSVPSLSVKPAG